MQCLKTTLKTGSKFSKCSCSGIPVTSRRGVTVRGRNQPKGWLETQVLWVSSISAGSWSERPRSFPWGNTTSEVRWDEAALGDGDGPTTTPWQLLYPLFWGEPGKGEKARRGRRRGKAEYCTTGSALWKAMKKYIGQMLSLGPWWCPAPISDRSFLCFRRFHPGKILSPVSCLSDGKCDICRVACSRNSPLLVNVYICWCELQGWCRPQQPRLHFSYGICRSLTHWIWELEGLLWFMDAHHFKVIFSLYGLGETCLLMRTKRTFSWCSTITCISYEHQHNQLRL